MAVSFDCSGFGCSGALEVVSFGCSNALASWQRWTVVSDFCRSSEFAVLVTTLAATAATKAMAALITPHCGSSSSSNNKYFILLPISLGVETRLYVQVRRLL